MTIPLAISGMSEIGRTRCADLCLSRAAAKNIIPLIQGNLAKILVWCDNF